LSRQRALHGLGGGKIRNSKFEIRNFVCTVIKPGAPLAGLYVHVPFCTSVCPYCDFAVTIAGEERREAYVEGVIREAALHAGLGLEFDTVYLGGGTPSSLRPDQLRRVLDGLGRELRVAPQARLHLEVNPEDVCEASAEAWQELGVAFVSLGAQALDDASLRALGRRHSAAEARAATRLLTAAGFGTVSIDLIFARPGQTAASWRAELEQAAELGVHHLSCYQLTFHDETVLGRRLRRGELAAPSEDSQAELFFATHETLAAAGLPAYEVSNFAAGPEHRSRHNRKYWRHLPYLGLGPSAHSFAGGRRWWNRRKLRLWQAAVDGGLSPVEAWEEPDRDELLLEKLMLGLRTTDGVDLEELRSHDGVDLVADNREIIERWCASGHLRAGDGRLRPTLRGLAVADAIAVSFGPGSGPAIGRSP
jgi:oxygen-independent coproporphyrinogen-3 oxidase